MASLVPPAGAAGDTTVSADRSTAKSSYGLSPELNVKIMTLAVLVPALAAIGCAKDRNFRHPPVLLEPGRNPHTDPRPALPQPMPGARTRPGPTRPALPPAVLLPPEAAPGTSGPPGGSSVPQGPTLLPPADDLPPEPPPPAAEPEPRRLPRFDPSRTA